MKYHPPTVTDGERQKNRDEMTPIEKEAHASFENCGKACEEQERCFQYVYSEGVCGFSYSYRLGYKRPREGNVSFKSGFVLDKIKKYGEANRCNKPEWLFGS